MTQTAQVDNAPSVAVFSTKPYDSNALVSANQGALDLQFLSAELNPLTAKLAAGCRIVSPFVHDDLGAETLEQLAAVGVELVAMRCAGFNNVDVEAATRLGIKVVRVPEYSPYAVAEHCIGLILSLNRKIHRAHNRVRENNFALDGLLGFDLHGKTIGVVGTGKIGTALVRICAGFGMRILATDVQQSTDCVALGADYVDIDELTRRSDIITLHCPLNESTHHLIDTERIAMMSRGVMLINTSRGGLVDTPAVIAGLKSGMIGHLGLDVYEEEDSLFFEDLSETVITDDVFSRLLTFPNVLITGHQAFFTADALSAIAEMTIDSARRFLDGSPIDPAVSVN